MLHDVALCASRLGPVWTCLDLPLVSYCFVLFLLVSQAYREEEEEPSASQAGFRVLNHLNLFEFAVHDFHVDTISICFYDLLFIQRCDSVVRNGGRADSES
jgi:hypothetical protein